ncbi:MAG: hypothetical protein WCK58_14490 [Chloroflexota bacterium]
MGWPILALRRLRDDIAPTVGLLVLVLATALLASLAPRVVTVLGNDAVVRQVAAQPPAARSIVLVQHRIVVDGPAGDPLAGVRLAGDALRRTFPSAVRGLIDRTDEIVDSGRFHVEKATTDPAFLRLRIQPGIGAHLRYTAGSAPTAAVGSQDGVGPEKMAGVPLYEAGISSATAARFGVALGETLQLRGDAGDPLIGRQEQPFYTLVRITGIYEVLDPEADYWLDDPLAIHPVIRALSAEVQLLDAVVVLDDGAYGPLSGSAESTGRRLRMTWRSFVDPALITSREVPALVTAFRRLGVAYPSANVTAAQDTAMRTGLLAVLEAQQAGWVSAESIMAVTALGPILVGIATLGLVALLAGRRRRLTMDLARSRGASGRGVLGPAALEGLLIALPAAVAALLAARLLVPVGPRPATIAAALGVVAVAVGVVVLTVLPVARASGPDRRPDGRMVRRPGARRLVFETLVVVLSVGAAWLLRERGIHAAGSGGATPSVDPLTAAVPALVGIAAGLVAMRCFPILMAGVAWVARHRRGLVPMLAARRSTEGGVTAAVLLVLLATATVGSFAAAALGAIDRGAELGSWQRLGGDYRLGVPTGALPNGFEPGSLPGVEAAAGEFRSTVPLGLAGPQTLFSVVEAGNLARVLAGTPIAPEYPAGFVEAGAVPGPIPAIISRRLAESPRGVKAGETFTISVEGYALSYRADKVVDAWPGMPPDRGFVIVSRERFLAAAPAARIVPVSAVVRAPAGDAEALRAAVAAVSPAIETVSRYSDVVARQQAPVTEAVRTMILLAALVTGAYAALGVAAALALAGVARGPETARLRTMGLTAREGFGLLVLEHAPVAVSAYVAGGALGIALLVVLRPALGLGDLVGAPADVPLAIEGPALLAISAAMAAIVALGLVVGAILQRRVAPTAALRGRFE